ncbi:MAG: non-ribosomal peptide synthetase, partial [bacterium]|nr:non-ribosomal peptide synthetase [bacterium]
ANEIQASINLETGPIMKLVHFQLDDGDRLLIVIHHLVIDGVSWRILFEDFDILYRQYQNGDPLTLPLKTDSFKEWAEKLSRYADSQSFLKEKSHWESLESIAAAVPPIETDFSPEDDYHRDTVSLSFRLNEEQTHLLLTTVNQAFSTEINDILLVSLGLGMKKWRGYNRLLIALEGHGREDILEDININRTLGW